MPGFWREWPACGGTGAGAVNCVLVTGVLRFEMLVSVLVAFVVLVDCVTCLLMGFRSCSGGRTESGSVWVLMEVVWVCVA